MGTNNAVGYINKKAASVFTSLSPRGLDYARERGDLPFHLVGRRVVFAVKDLDVFMQRHRVEVKAE